MTDVGNHEASVIKQRLDIVKIEFKLFGYSDFCLFQEVQSPKLENQSASILKILSPSASLNPQNLVQKQFVYFLRFLDFLFFSSP